MNTETRKTTIPTLEFFPTTGKTRFNYDIRTVEIEGETLNTAKFVEVDHPTRDNIINAIIRTRYSASQELAIHRKQAANEPGAAVEFEEYNNFVNYCKNLF
jgi:hypothetical protein